MNEIDELRSRIEALEAALRELTFEHVRAERVDIVNADGSLVMAAASGARSADTVIDGELLAPNRERPGLIFFNEEGDECGGLTWSGKRVAGVTEAYGGLTIDRFKNDQIVSLGYEEADGGHDAGLRIVDRPELSIMEAFKRRDAIVAMPEGEERNAAESELMSTNPWGQQRLFAGRDRSGAAVIQLSDGSGRVRLRLAVAADGEALIEFLDDAGEVAQTISLTEG